MFRCTYRSKAEDALVITEKIHWCYSEYSGSTRFTSINYHSRIHVIVLPFASLELPLGNFHFLAVCWSLTWSIGALNGTSVVLGVARGRSCGKKWADDLLSRSGSYTHRYGNLEGWEWHGKVWNCESRWTWAGCIVLMYVLITFPLLLDPSICPDFRGLPNIEDLLFRHSRQGAHDFSVPIFWDRLEKQKTPGLVVQM